MKCPCCSKDVEEKVILDKDGKQIKTYKEVFCPHCGVNMPMLYKKTRRRNFKEKHHDK